MTIEFKEGDRIFLTPCSRCGGPQYKIYQRTVSVPSGALVWEGWSPITHLDDCYKCISYLKDCVTELQKEKHNA